MSKSGLEQMKEQLGIIDGLVSALRFKLGKRLEGAPYDVHPDRTQEIITDVIETLFEGVEINVQPKECAVQVGQFNLRALNSRGEVATIKDHLDTDNFLTVDNFTIESPIPEMMITQVEFPIFDASLCSPVTVKVTVIPFPLGNIMSAIAQKREDGSSE